MDPGLALALVPGLGLGPVLVLAPGQDQPGQESLVPGLGPAQDPALVLALVLELAPVQAQVLVLVVPEPGLAGHLRRSRIRRRRTRLAA